MLPELTLKSAVAALAMVLPAMAAPQMAKRTDNHTGELSLTAKLRLADTAADRYKLLDDDQFVYDFNGNNPLATAQNFPALVGSGSSFTITSLDACSMSFLHLHPRATELFAVTSGRVLTEMIPEIGVPDSEGNQRVIRADLTAGMVTLFPGGSFHTQVNPECVPANITAAFNSEDPGAAVIAEQMFGFSDDVISTAFGGAIAGEDIDKIRDAIPGPVVTTIEECLSKCGKQKRQL